MRLLSYLLPFLLLLAQQGASVHELSHYGEAALKQGHSSHQQIPKNKSCERCLVFAQIAGAVHSEAPRIATPNLFHQHPQYFFVASFAERISSARNRGPPHFL